MTFEGFQEEGMTEGSASPAENAEGRILGDWESWAPWGKQGTDPEVNRPKA